MIVGGDRPPAERLDWPNVHWHDDGCPGGHRNSEGAACHHIRWVCQQCHDDPAPGHVCPNCGLRGPDDRQ